MSSGCLVSDSKTSIFCCTPSSKIWKASTGRSGAGRLFSSRTLTSTLTRLTLTRMRPCCAGSSLELLSRLSLLTGSGGLVFSGVEVVVLVAGGLDLGFRAQGGRSELSCDEAVTAMNNVAAARQANCRARKLRVHIRGLRCRFHRGCRRRHGRQFSVGPDGTVFEVFFFPDRHSTFESVNGIAAGVGGGGAMRGTYFYVHAGFSDFEAAKAVDHGNAMDGKLVVEMRGDLLNFCQG